MRPRRQGQKRIASPDETRAEKPGLRRYAEKRAAEKEITRAPKLGPRLQGQKRTTSPVDNRENKLGPRIQGEKRAADGGEEDYRRRLRPRPSVQLNPRRGYAEEGEKRRGDDCPRGDRKRMCKVEQATMEDQVAALLHTLCL